MLNEYDFNFIKLHLGRIPHGALEVTTYGQDKNPQVVRVSPIIDGKPFPTHFWLVCPFLTKKIDLLESRGLIAQLEDVVIPQDQALLEKLREDHLRYIKIRNSYLPTHWKEQLSPTMVTSLETKGIGGISDFSRVRCLHMQYAFHLACGSVLGQYLDDHFLK